MMAGILVVAWITLGQVSKARAVVREEMALQNIRQVAHACLFYRRATKELPNDLTQLGAPASQPAYLPEALAQAAPIKQGYEFRYTRPDPNTFRLAADPLLYGPSGRRHYVTDQSLVVHSTIEDRPATEKDPQLR